MNTRERDCKDKLVIGVIELYSNGKEDAIRPFEMRGHENPLFHNHAENTVRKYRERMPNAEIHLVPLNAQGAKHLIDVGAKIVNISLRVAFTPSYLVELSKHAFIVKSAGNDADKGELGFATAGIACIVGAVDQNMKPRWYTSFGKGFVTCVAESGYMVNGRRYDGTSAAAPNIGSLLCQWYAWHFKVTGHYPTVEATNLFIRQNSHDIWEDGKDLHTGWGLFRLPHRFEATKIIIEPNNRTAKKIKFVEGEQPKEENVDLLAVPTIANDRILIPLRGVNEGLGLTVDWVNNQAIVIRG